MNTFYWKFVSVAATIIGAGSEAVLVVVTMFLANDAAVVIAEYQN
jgi:hypothetical protein